MHLLEFHVAIGTPPRALEVLVDLLGDAEGGGADVGAVAGGVLRWGLLLQQRRIDFILVDVDVVVFGFGVGVGALGVGVLADEGVGVEGIGGGGGGGGGG